MAHGLLLHVLVLYHVMQFRNFYLVFLSVSQYQCIAPCYAIYDRVSSRYPPHLKMDTDCGFMVIAQLY